MSKRPLNVGLIGGGGGNAFIAGPHQKAIFMDGTRRVTCGALHQVPAVAMESAQNWPYPIKGYPDYDTMIREEAKLPVGQRMDYGLIVTPNFVHFDPAMKLIKAGVPVFCEKPLTMTVDEAEKLAAAVKEKKIPFCVAHTYTGHWSSWFSRWIITEGILGKVRRVGAYYWQGWLAGRTEDQGVQQAVWRVNPAQAGASCCGGDIGTHAYMQLRFVTGLEVKKILFACLRTFVPDRKLDDNFTTVCELSNGAEAHICASQIMIGHGNDLGIEVNCEGGTLIWQQENSEEVIIHLPGQPKQTYSRGEVTRFLNKRVPRWLTDEPTLPSGHNEAFHDAFARLHRGFELDVRRHLNSKPPIYAGKRYPSVNDGLSHMRFVEAAVRSSNSASPVDL